jgi:RNA recognition motif-containing protein
LIEFFGQIGQIKEGKGKDKGKKKVWIYKDKQTGLPKGDATVSYEDPNGAKGAVDWFNNKPFEKGPNIQVSIAERKANPLYANQGGGGGGGYRGGGGGMAIRP